MPSRPRSALSGLTMLALSLATAPAHAWTEAAVRSVHAEVAIDRDARAHVTLHAVVAIHGGWLEGIELAGLDPDLVLDESFVPTAIDQDGTVYSPSLSVLDDGRVQVSFPGSSPRRGRVTVDLAYFTSLAHRATEPVDDGDTVRVRWTLPGWRSGLDGVQVDVEAPPGAARGPRDPRDTGAAVTFERVERDDAVVLRWRRAHLPRTLPWTVTVDVPASAMAPALRGPAILAPPPPPEVAREAADPDGAWLAVALALLLMAWLKLLAARRRATRAGSTARGLVPGPAWSRALVALAGAAGAAMLGPTLPAAGVALAAVVVLAAVVRPGPGPRASHLGAWHAADARWLAFAASEGPRRWLHPLGVVELDTPLGALTALAWLALPWIDGPLPMSARLVLAVLPLPLLASGTRRAFPVGAGEALAILLGRARRLSTLPHGVGLSPVVHLDVRGAVQEARVRTALEHRPEGLLRCDLTVAQLSHAGGWDRSVVLAVVTRAGSPAEEALGALDVEATPSRGGRRVLRIFPAPLGRAIPALGRVVEALAACPPAPVPHRGEAAPLETVHDLPAPRAVGL